MVGAARVATQAGGDGYGLQKGKGERTGENFSCKAKALNSWPGFIRAAKFAKALVSCTIKRIPRQPRDRAMM